VELANRVGKVKCTGLPGISTSTFRKLCHQPLTKHRNHHYTLTHLGRRGRVLRIAEGYERARYQDPRSLSSRTEPLLTSRMAGPTNESQGAKEGLPTLS